MGVQVDVDILLRERLPSLPLVPQVVDTGPPGVITRVVGLGGAIGQHEYVVGGDPDRDNPVLEQDPQIVTRPDSQDGPG
ncbi:hypothetical protein NJB1604_31550 [Mycobacterium marinum]|nr:hypothetical protein NJB1604_31550 [Mycobacterium marinum]